MRYNHFRSIAVMMYAAAVNPEHFIQDKSPSNRIRTVSKLTEEGLKNRASQKEKEFVIKGHKIMAYSKKDAIARLRHKGII